MCEGDDFVIDFDDMCRVTVHVIQPFPESDDDDFEF